MQKGHETEQWLSISAQVLMEEEQQLQLRILEIYKNNPGLCRYATDLAQLRMSGPDMENCLLQILDAKTAESVDVIVHKSAMYNKPTERVLIFFADLVKNDLKRLQTVH